jgi:hypothetical protein
LAAWCASCWLLRACLVAGWLVAWQLAVLGRAHCFQGTATTD